MRLRHNYSKDLLKTQETIKSKEWVNRTKYAEMLHKMKLQILDKKEKAMFERLNFLLDNKK